jgi:hypothetical protein
MGQIPQGICNPLDKFITTGKATIIVLAIAMEMG